MKGNGFVQKELALFPAESFFNKSNRRMIAENITNALLVAD
ncbi:MAG: hypothetical protein WCE68_02385 [Anaerolineales bacterium]